MKVTFKNDVITNPATGKAERVIVKSKLPCRVKDLGIGLGLIGVGLCWLLKKTFEEGAWAYCKTEFDTLDDLGLINRTSDGKVTHTGSKRGNGEV